MSVNTKKITTCEEIYTDALSTHEELAWYLHRQYSRARLVLITTVALCVAVLALVLGQGPSVKILIASCVASGLTLFIAHKVLASAKRSFDEVLTESQALVDAAKRCVVNVVSEEFGTRAGSVCKACYGRGLELVVHPSVNCQQCGGTGWIEESTNEDRNDL